MRLKHCDWSVRKTYRSSSASSFSNTSCASSTSNWIVRRTEPDIGTYCILRSKRASNTIINTAPNAVAAVNTTITGLLTPNAPRTPIRVGAFPYATFPPTADFIYDEPVRWQNKEYIREGSELLVNGTLDAVQQIVADPQNDGTNGGAGDAPVNIIVLDPFALGDPKHRISCWHCFTWSRRRRGRSTSKDGRPK